MFKGLVSRVVRAVSARPPPVKDIAGASEAKLSAGTPSSSSTLRSGQRNGHPPPAPLTHLLAVDHSNGLRRAPWAFWGSRKELEEQDSAPAPETARSEAAVLKDLLENIDRILAAQQEELAAQEEELAKPSFTKIFTQTYPPGVTSPLSHETASLDVTAHIEAIRLVTGYTFKDPDFVRGAIFRTGRFWKGKDIGRHVQLQLALIGDKFLDFGSLSVNFGRGLDIMRPNWQWLMSNATLHYCAQRSGLPQMLAESGHAALIQGDADKGFGTMVEALIGAVYEDSGRDGAVTDEVTTKLLGTSMKHQDVFLFAADHSRCVKKPQLQFYWEDIVKAQVQSRLEQGGGPDTTNQVMEKIRSEALSREKIRQHMHNPPRPKGTKLQKRLSREAKLAAKPSRFFGLLSGDKLRTYIDYIKLRQKRYSNRRRRLDPETKSQKIATFQAYIDRAEERLRAGEACCTM